MAAIVMAFLVLGLLGTAANASEFRHIGFPEDPRDFSG
jgi:hypothetical protein